MWNTAVKFGPCVVRVACAAALLCGVPARGAAAQAADEGRCPEVRRCLDLLADGIDFIESGRWEAASVVLEEVVAGLEGRSPHARDLARAYVYLGVARLQIADAAETRRLFAEARMRDPTLQLGPAEFPRDVLEIWEEARELGMLVVESEPPGAQVSVDGVLRGRSPVGVAGLAPGEYRVALDHAGYAGVSRALAVAAGRTERLFVSMVPAPDAIDARSPDGVTRTARPDAISTTTRPRAVSAAQAPAGVSTTPERFSADTTKKMGRSLWRTLVGALSITAGVVVAGRQCNLKGAERWDDGTQVETLGGVLQARKLAPGPYGRSKYVRWWGDCRMKYEFELDGPHGTIRGHVEDHDGMLRDAADALVLGEESRARYVEAMSRDSGRDAASFDERLKHGLAESVGEVRTGMFFPRDRLAGGLVLAGLGALIVTKWSDGVVVEDVALSVTPSGGMLASRSFGW